MRTFFRGPEASLRDKIRAQILKLEAIPVGAEQYPTALIKDYLLGVLDAAAGVRDVALDMLEDTSFLPVADAITLAMNDLNTAEQGLLRDGYPRIINEAVKRGSPTVMLPGLRLDMLQVLRAADRTVASLQDISAAKPGFLDLPGVRQLLNGIAAVGAAGDRMDVFFRKVEETVDAGKDAIEESGKAGVQVQSTSLWVKLAAGALAFAGASYGLWKWTRARRGVQRR
jgi:hypothetical protein